MHSSPSAAKMMAATPECTLLPIMRPDKEPAVESDCSKEQTSRKLYDEVAKATAHVYAGGGQGSGFFVEDGSRFVTNAHVVGGTYEPIELKTLSGQSYTARIEKLDDLHDLAVLRLENNAHHDASLKVGPSLGLKAGDDIYGLGHPQGRDPVSISPGKFVAFSSFADALKRSGDFSLDDVMKEAAKENPANGPSAKEYFTARRVEGELAIDHGNSGGPLVDAKGVVVGVDSNLASSAQFKNRAQAIPSEYVSALLDPASNKFSFEYGKASFLRVHPGISGLVGVVSTGFALGLPRVGAGLEAAAGLLTAKGDIDNILNGSATDRLYGGLDLASTVTMTAGAALSIFGRRGLGYGAILASSVLNFAGFTKPTETYLENIKRNDGQTGEPFLWRAFH